MAGMRDKLVHDYFGVDYGIVWDVAIKQSSVTRREIEEILYNEEPPGQAHK